MKARPCDGLFCVRKIFAKRSMDNLCSPKKASAKKRNGPPLLWRPRMEKQLHSDISAASSASRPWSVPRASLIFGLQQRILSARYAYRIRDPVQETFDILTCPLKGITNRDTLNVRFPFLGNGTYSGIAFRYTTFLVFAFFEENHRFPYFGDASATTSCYANFGKRKI